MSKKQIHVHFMGIGGSGCASVAMLAHSQGFHVSGCDQNVESYYAQELKKLNIEIYLDHSSKHLTEGVDIVAVSPAIFDISPDNEELLAARDKGILMTWQEFMGRYLQKDKRVIAISGTHGKTTTTFMTAELMIDAGFDPNVIGGSVYKKWGNGGRSGNSNLFLCEADEFNRNFHNYHPEIAVMNNVEMDHPECYNSFEEVLESFGHFVVEGGQLKTLIFNADSEGAVEVCRRAAEDIRFKDVKVYAFSRKQPDLSVINHDITVVQYRTDKKTPEGTAFSFELDGHTHSFFMNLYGEYNVSNAVVATLITSLLGASDEEINSSLLKFSGVGRRFDRVGLMRGIPVFDDYAHHPTEIASVLGMVKEYFEGHKSVAVFEPHQVSRLRLMLKDYADALMKADHIIVAKTHLGREIHNDVHPITPEEWSSFSDKFIYEEDNDKIKEHVNRLIDDGECDIITVIGAANSYKISRLLISE